MFESSIVMMDDIDEFWLYLLPSRLQASPVILAFLDFESCHLSVARSRMLILCLFELLRCRTTSRRQPSAPRGG